MEHDPDWLFRSDDDDDSDGVARRGALLALGAWASGIAVILLAAAAPERCSPGPAWADFGGSSCSVPSPIAVAIVGGWIVALSLNLAATLQLGRGSPSGWQFATRCFWVAAVLALFA